MSKKYIYNVVANDYGEVEWTPRHEAALRLIEDAAACLEMTVGEFADTLSMAERSCPCCEDSVLN